MAGCHGLIPRFSHHGRLTLLGMTPGPSSGSGDTAASPLLVTPLLGVGRGEEGGAPFDTS